MYLLSKMERLRTRGGNGAEKQNWKKHTGVFWSVGEGNGTKDALCAGKTWLWCKSLHLGEMWCNQAHPFVCVNRNNVFATIPFRYTSKFEGVWEQLHPRQGRGLMCVCLIFLELFMKQTWKFFRRIQILLLFFFFFGSKKAIVFVSLQSCPTWKGVACPGITPTFLQNL